MKLLQVCPKRVYLFYRIYIEKSVLQVLKLLSRHAILNYLHKQCILVANPNYHCFDRNTLTKQLAFIY